MAFSIRKSNIYAHSNTCVHTHTHSDAHAYTYIPSRSMELSMLVASDEATIGSVMPKHDRMLPSISGSSLMEQTIKGESTICNQRWFKARAVFATVKDTPLAFTMVLKQAYGAQARLDGVAQLSELVFDISPFSGSLTQNPLTIPSAAQGCRTEPAPPYCRYRVPHN